MKALVLSVMPLALPAQGLGEVRARLENLAGKAPLIVQAERYSWSRDLKEATLPEEGLVRARLEAGPAGIKVVPGSESAQALKKSTEVPRPLKDREASEVLAAALTLNKTLGEAQVVSETAEIRNGVPSKHFRFTLPLEDEAEAKKHLKEAWRTLDLWVAADGTPQASLEAFQIRGRVLFMSIEASAKIRREYRKLGDRIVMVLEDKEGRGSGMGQGSEGRTLLTVTPL